MHHDPLGMTLLEGEGHKGGGRGIASCSEMDVLFNNYKVNEDNI